MTVVRVEALACRAEPAFTLNDPDRAAAVLAEPADVPLDPSDRERPAETLASAEELRRRS